MDGTRSAPSFSFGWLKHACVIGVYFHKRNEQNNVMWRRRHSQGYTPAKRLSRTDPSFHSERRQRWWWWWASIVGIFFLLLAWNRFSCRHVFPQKTKHTETRKNREKKEKAEKTAPSPPLPNSRTTGRGERTTQWGAELLSHNSHNNKGHDGIYISTTTPSHEKKISQDAAGHNRLYTEGRYRTYPQPTSRMISP